MAVTVSAASLLDVQKFDYPRALTGVWGLDRELRGLPRGTITEITGPQSAGRTSVVLSTLAEATGKLEYCAYIDAVGAMDPASASAAGIDLERLIWVRSAGDGAAALRAADLLLHGGGFGLICLDLGGLDPRQLNRIPTSCWFRFRRAIANTQTALLLLADTPCARSSAGVWLRFESPRARWNGRSPAKLFRGISSHLEVRRSGAPREISIELVA